MAPGKIRRLFCAATMRTLASMSLCAAVGLLFACVGTPGGGAPDPPAWVISRPTVPGYYVGIGMADTGVPDDDRVTAESRAKAQIGGEISTRIVRDASSRAEMRSERGEVGDVEFHAVEQITMLVDQTLHRVEIVDTFSHPAHGTWVFARLNRAEWDAAQDAARAELRARVAGAIHGDGSAPTARDELDRLAAAWGLLRESPHGSTVQGELFGEMRFLSDAVAGRFREIFSAFAVVPDSPNLTVVAGERVEVTGVVTGRRRTGRIPVSLNAGHATTPVVTDADGRFTAELPLDTTEPVAFTVGVRIDTDRWPDIDAIARRDTGETPVRITVVAPSVYLRVMYDGLSSPATAEHGVMRFLSRLVLPGELSAHRDEPPAGAPAGSFAVDAEFHLTDFPQFAENAPFVSEGYLSVSVHRSGRLLGTVATNSVREGGITREQAHARVVTAILHGIEKDHGLAADVEAAFLAR